jgi:multidrug efflux system outer membrane protein
MKAIPLSIRHDEAKSSSRPALPFSPRERVTGRSFLFNRAASMIACACMPFWLAACATQTPPANVSATVPAQWHAALPSAENRAASQSTDDAAHLPHNGTLTDLSQWWQQVGDPLLVELIEAAEAVSPSVASAKSRIEQARAIRVSAGAALLPTLDASVSASRSSEQPSLPMGDLVQGGLTSSWEIDLFGRNRASRDGAQARLEGAQAGWHNARVSVAAEVANQYFSLRACEKLVVITLADAASRAETSRLIQLSAAAGFQAPATAGLARASAAEGHGRTIQQRAQCDLDIKALVALTAVPEPDLRKKLAETPADLPQAATISIASLPARTLAQRPDVFSAEREVAAASAEVGSAQAQRYPRLSLSGSIGAASFRTAGASTNFPTWTIGPLALTLPLFDGGTRRANVGAAQARYEEAVANYRGNVRQAVREVEEALVNLQSTGARSEDALVAVDGYRTSFNGTEARYQSGLASLLELEDTRRTRLAAEIALVTLQRERIAAWVALYRAAGGGWTTASLATTASSAQP